ncbi:hypothetical protein RHMOL_Rhmol07G0312500 [Rhododendron molle]|uniref:Uncharacterized protein n=1 Tax=Rhododendron molle TaxID=49168 RepID=A0ACC0N780_RHOML|nr:hypothetical protein RHMOL_Rhmol07G0312500 [Rhododendron molle]
MFVGLCWSYKQYLLAHRGTVRRTGCPNCNKRLFCFFCKLPWHAVYWCEESGKPRDRNDVAFEVLAERKKWMRAQEEQIPFSLEEAHTKFRIDRALRVETAVRRVGNVAGWSVGGVAVGAAATGGEEEEGFQPVKCLFSCQATLSTLSIYMGLVVDCASNVEFGSALALTYTRLQVTKAATHVNVNWLFHLVVLLEESVNCHITALVNLCCLGGFPIFALMFVGRIAWSRVYFQGKVKQIVGSTIQDLKEGSSTPVTNFESDKSAAEYANIYKEDGLTGGHVIMIGADPLSKSAAMEALHAYPGGLHVGGGINPDNALSYIEGGASHVIITSYVFNNGQMELQRLKELARVVGKRRLVLDLSCRKKEGKYAIVTDRWQKFTDVFLDEKIMDFLATYADEFLVHGVDVEGKKLGIDEELVTLLGSHSPIPVTYAGGVTVMSDLERIKAAGMERVDVTVGSALDIFGGNLAYKDVVGWHAQQQLLAV